MFLPLNATEPTISTRLANFLNISPTGQIMQNLQWLGLFSDEKIGVKVETAAQAMAHLLSEKLKLTSDIRDMVVLMHRMHVTYPDQNRDDEQYIATMIHNGERGGYTAMSTTVGLPAGVVAKLLLTDKMSLTGCHIPTHPQIYRPVLDEIAGYGLVFKEKITPKKKRK
jgi:saccharopine dehydrogenase-like NADP-dependent oxidoreductase